MNVRSALLGLFVALTIAFASTTVYESGIRTTLTSTGTLTSTLSQTTTVTASPPISSTTRLTTSTLFSSGSTAAFGVGNSAAFVLNSSDGLGLSLQVEPSFNGSLIGNYTITVRESNFLNSLNNVTQADEWGYPKGSLNPANPCGVNSPIPVGFAVVQGRYGQNNYTSAKALTLYDTNAIFVCTTITFTASSYVYAFQPLNDTFSFPSASTLPDHGAASVSITTSGYWTGGQNNVAAAFKTFSPGYYTVIGADEWGNVALLQFYVP